ncbi:ankyrin repeat domain-containing protein 26 isoform X6 [Tyto alba]|uniref:ankyrin repeat domain-containing protein 26 isoform X6 n=1 Tax=Tyto alba TaxID=56313 RepID=UPI001C672B73|nr:ankyrin repeat domain-containing protein 26 isoform X6 [Tyto alba]
MKRIFGFGRKRKGQPPSGSASLPCPAGAYELRQKDLSKLHRAAAGGDLAQVRQGLKKYGIDGRDKAERTALHLACASGHVDVVTYLVENKCKLNLFDNDNRSPLMKAVQCQQEECVAVLLEHGADPNLADADGNTALHLAVLSPNTAVAGLLLEHNTNIDAQNKEGYTPLILAVSERHEEIVEFLLKKGANVHARDQCERTPLMTAASGGELNLVKVLLRYGADVSHKDTNGWTAEDYAVIHGYSSLSKQLAEYADWENTGEASAGGAQSIVVLSTPHRAGAAGFTLGAPAVDRGGMQQSPNLTSRTGKSRKAIDDFSQGDSIRSSEKEGSDDSWHTSEEEELDFTPKKLQKPNLTLLMNASQQFRKNNDGDGSRIESPKSPKKSLKQRTPSDANLNKGGCEESLNQDVSDASNLEEEELEEEEDDENDNGDEEEDYEEEEEEEEDEDLTQDEKEEEDLEDEESQSNDILEEEQGKKTEPKGEINQKLEYFSNTKYEEEDQCGTGDVCDNNKISKEVDEKVKESVDPPVSFIAGCYERLQENITAMSPKKMNNEVSCKSIPKQAVFQNLNNLQDTQESWNRKSMIQEKFHKNADSCFADSEMTDWKKERPQPLADSYGLKEKKSSFSDGFESGNDSWSATKKTRLESQNPNSVVLEHVGGEDTEEEQYEDVDNKVCGALKQECESFRSNRHEENLRTAFHLSTEEESSEQEEEKEQEKRDTGEEQQTAVVESVKNSICNDSHQVHDASKGNAGALPAAGAEEEEDAESPWDSEIIQTDSESPRKVSSSVLLPDADRYGACSQIVSGEHDNGFLEKPNNSQLKTPEPVLEMSETSPKRMQQKSDLLEEFGLGDAEDIEGEYSGSTFHMSSSAEKEDIKDGIGSYGMQVEKKKSKERCFKMQEVAKQEDLDKINTLSGNITNQQMNQKLALRKNDHLKVEKENTVEEKHKKKFPSEERSKLMRLPIKGKFALSAKVAKKNKRWTSKQKANQQMSSSSGNNFQVLDDGTFSETSQDEGRPAAKTGGEKNKVSIQMDVTDDLDLTQSSDTTSEDVELPTSTYKEAMLLLEQLSVDHTGSAILLKIQNILLEYEQIIEHEKNRYTAVLKEVRKLESEKEESQLKAEETQDLKSILAHQEVEWKSDIQSLKFTLKQEEEKRLRVETLYEKTRETLRRSEDQYCKEMEEKQQLEIHSRNLEMELITVRKLLKQVEEERDETQRQLSQEKSARALQEGILNNHLWREKELEEETRRTIGKNSEESDTEREKDLLYKNQLLQDEIAILRLEIDQVRHRHQEEEGKYLEENETLKEKNEDLKKELKLNEEALTETVFQYNGQLNLLKTESAVLTSKLEQTKESKDKLETEIESFRSRLNTAVQELERHQSSKIDIERTFQRERDEWLRLQDKLHQDLSDVRETRKNLSQQLSKAESKANSLENELHQLKQTLREKTLLLEMTQKELSQAQCQAKECDHARQLEKDQVSKFIIKQESMQERLAQLQSENLLLRQQMEDMQNKGIIKEKVVNDVQDRFNDIFNKLRADTEKQVYLVEERNKELNAKCTDLREQVFKYETDKVEREGMVRQLQQELADALKKQSMSEASLEVTTRYRSDLEEDKLRLQKELEKVKTKLRELEEQHLQSEHRVHDLKASLDNKEREVIASSQKLQDLLLASSGTNTTIKQLEEHVQRLEIENARLEATVQQQSNRIEALQRDLQASASVHNRLEDLITGLRTTQAAAEDHQQQMQKQNVLTLTSKDLHSMREEQLKSRSHLEERVAQLDREKAELLEQCENERKKVKKLVELKRPVELRLDQEMKRNIELQKDCKRLKRLLSRAMKKLRVYEERESQLNLQGEMKNRYSEMVNEVGRLRTKVGELSQQLEIESKKCMQLEEQNQDLREELSTMRGNHEKLEKSKCQLKEEVANLKYRLETNMVDHSQIEQYKREMEERAGQEIRQKLQEVNLFLQTQAASQDRLEQIRASHHASLRSQLKHRIKDLECELDRIKNTQQDSIFQKESTQAEVERYKELYLEEVKIRRGLANKLERANERLAEANAKLLQERHRSKSLITSSIVSGGLAASPVLYSTELGHLGNSLALNRSLSLGGSFLSPTGNALSSRNRVEAYVAKLLNQNFVLLSLLCSQIHDKVRRELDEKITKELEQATAELETGSAGASPMNHRMGEVGRDFWTSSGPTSLPKLDHLEVVAQDYVGFSVPPRMETPQPPWETCASTQPPSQEKCVS